MTFQNSVLDRYCRNCGSSSYHLQGQHTPVAKVVCSDCNMVRSTWHDFVQALKDEPKSPTSAERSPRSRSRSETVAVWSKLESTTQLRRRQDLHDRELLRDHRDAQPVAAAEVGSKFP